MFIAMIQHYLIQQDLGPNLALGLAITAGLISLLLAGLLSLFISRRYLLKLLRYLTAHIGTKSSEDLIKHKVFLSLVNLVPLFIISYMTPLLTDKSVPFLNDVILTIKTISAMAIVIVMTVSLKNILNATTDIYRHIHKSHHKSIKSYTQVAKIILYGICAILIVAILLNQSPLTLLTGLGALTAILLLLFKDSILGFVASVQIATNDMVRIHDWITIPKFGVDGDVLDISLNTIKIQNFDKTIINIPTSAILTSGIKNWRGMQESGGRRIKRDVLVDMHSIKFCNKEMLLRFSNLQYIPDHIDNKIKQLKTQYNEANFDLTELGKGKHLTNIGLFRVYLESYLNDHPDIHQDLTFMVRQLKSTGKGLPIEIYIFTNDTDWKRYETIQADIFDHILAIIPEFDLSVFQDISSESANAYMNRVLPQN